jgi:hypothetical protein
MLAGDCESGGRDGGRGAAGPERPGCAYAGRRERRDPAARISSSEAGAARPHSGLASGRRRERGHLAISSPDSYDAGWTSARLLARGTSLSSRSRSLLCVVAVLSLDSGDGSQFCFVRSGGLVHRSQRLQFCGIALRRRANFGWSY